jgi:hypothetical protein
MIAECENLDAFLDGELSLLESNRYESHLHVCETCREAVNQQRWIDALLGSHERLELEPVSPALRGTVCNSFALRRRQVRLVACGLAAAAAFMVAVGWTVVLSRPARIPISNIIVENVARADEPSPNPSLKGRGTAEASSATFVAGPDVLAVPVASRYSNVTIVRVYPTYQSSVATKATSDETDADYFNGG